MNQGLIALALTGIQGLLEGIEDEVRGHGATDPPADDVSGEHVDDEGHVDHPLPARNVRKIRYPQLIWPLSSELTVDPVQRTRCARVAQRRAHSLAANDAAKAMPAHQPLDGAAGHGHAVALELFPDLDRTVDLVVGVPDALDFGQQRCIALGAGTTQIRIASLGNTAPIGRRGDLQYAADRLDPVDLAVLVDIGG